MRNLVQGVLFSAVGVLLSLAAHADPPALQQDRGAARVYDLAAREAQYQELAAIPGAKVQYGKFGRVRQLDGPTGFRVPQAVKLKRGDSADPLFQKVKRILLANGNESLVVRESGPEPGGSNRFLFTDQVIDGVPVIGGHVNFIVKPTGEILMMNSLFVPEKGAKRTPNVSINVAKDNLKRTLIEAQLADEGSVDLGAEGSLAFWTDEGRAEVPRLMWMVDAQFTRKGEPHVVRFGLDAETAEILHSQQLRFDLHRTVYTYRYLTSTPTPLSSQLLWVEGNPNGSDSHALSIYERVVHPVNAWRGIHPFAYETLGLIAHWGVAKNAGFIYGTDSKPYLIFSDERAFDDDAIAHEYGHGLFQGWVPHQPSGVRFWNEWFAGNEFTADLSSVMTDIYRYGVRGETWAITDLRNWQDPDSKGSSFIDWYPHRNYGNPLIGLGYANSTIFGHAVYLMINGGTHNRTGAAALSGPIPNINVPQADPLQVKNVLAYGIFLVKLYNDHFDGPTYKLRTMQAASQLYGPAAGVLNTVERAWTAVGIGYNCSSPPPVPNYQVWPGYCKGRHTITWTAQPGVKYHGEVRPYHLGWDFAATTSVDGAVSQCKVNPSGPAAYHMRACNGCGCSDWSYDHDLEYWNICQ